MITSAFSAASFTVLLLIHLLLLDQMIYLHEHQRLRQILNLLSFVHVHDLVIRTR